MKKPVGAVLSPELLEIQTKWLEEKDRKKQELIFAREFCPGFVPLFRELPLNGAPLSMERPKALVSVLGLSWQPVALMAAWVKPEKMLVVGTEDSFKCSPIQEKHVLDLIAELSGVPRGNMEHRVIPDDGELEIYREVRNFIGSNCLSSRDVAIDPTGGKKSMSVSAGLVGFLTGSIIVYVDYLEYSGRIPKAGTEYPRLLMNPLSIFGDVEYDKIRAAFRRGDYKEAEDLARDLGKKLYEPRPAEALCLMAEGYGLWNEFLFQKAKIKLDDLVSFLGRFAKPSRWEWAKPLIDKLQLQTYLLACLSSKDLKTFENGIPLVINHLAAAKRAWEQGRLFIAILLAYATLERYVDLCLLADYEIEDESPDYKKVKDKLNKNCYDKIGEELFGKNYKEHEPSGPIMLMNGVQLLTALNEETIPKKFIGKIRGLASARNKCPYEHGLKVKELGEDEVQKHIDTVKEIISIRYNSIDPDGIDAALERYVFPGVPDVMK
jgi:hypothetical protein